MKRWILGSSILITVIALSPRMKAGESDDRPKRMVMMDVFAPGAFLGVSTLDLTPELRTHLGAPKTDGILVSRVAPESPAATAGIKVGDVIVRVDGHLVDSPFDLARALRDKKPGDPASVEIIRERSSRTVSAKLAKRDAEPEDVFFYDRRVIDRVGPPEDDMHRLETMLSSPAWKERLDRVDECEKVRERLRAVEDRLHALEQKLEKK